MRREEILKNSLVDWAEYERFYNSASFQPYIPPYARWRHWRVRCADGVFCKWTRAVRSADDVRRMALTLCATDIFYSTSVWLAPCHKSTLALTGRKGASYRYADNLLLFSDEFYDVDNHDAEAALTDARKLLVEFAHRGREIEYVAYSGSKGYHISCPAEALKTLNPKRRVSNLVKKRKYYIRHLPRISSLDVSSTTDALRVRRLPGSLNSKTGRMCRLLTPVELLKPLDPAHLLGFATPRKERMTNPSASNEPSSGPSNPSPDDYFLSTRDVNTRDRVVVALKYQLVAHEDAQRLQAAYRLGNLWWFVDDEEQHWYLSETTHQRRRAEKVVKASKAVNQSTLRTYGEDYVPVALKPKGKLLGRSDAPVSDAHKAFFETVAYHDPVHLKLAHNKQLRFTRQTRRD